MKLFVTNRNDPKAENSRQPHPTLWLLILLSVGVMTLGGCPNSSVLSELTKPPNTVNQVAAPTFSPLAGTYFTSQDVAVSDTDSGATIYYTTDGSTPTTSSAAYTGSPIATGGAGTTTTIKAIAVKSGMTTSTVVIGRFSTVQTTQWADSESNSTNPSTAQFFGGTADSSGNVYAVGTEYAPSGTFYYGTVPVPSNGSSSGQPLLVEYNSAGAVQWVAQHSYPTAFGQFKNVAIGPNGYLYAVGNLSGTSTSTFGPNSLAFTGIVSSGTPVLIKYDASTGTAVSGVAAIDENVGAEFDSVAVDSSGNIYVLGRIHSGSNGYVSFGSNKTMQDPQAAGDWFLLKYDQNLTAQWVSSFTASTYSGSPHSVAVDSSGNVYVALGVSGAFTYDFGNGVTVAGAAGSNGVLVRYNSSGSAIWASESDTDVYWAVVCDSSGNIYVAGTGGAVLTKFNSLGSVLWRRSTQGSDSPSYQAITLDGTGNIFVAGELSGTSSVDFGNGVHCNGAWSGSSSLLVAEYDSGGKAQWAQSATVASDQSMYQGIGVDSSDNIYAIGWINGSSNFELGNGKSVTGGSTTGGANVVTAQYVSN